MLSDMIVFGILLIVFMIAPILLINDRYNAYQCSSYGELSSKEVKYNFMDICYVKEGDTYMRWDEYKVFITAKGLGEK